MPTGVSHRKDAEGLAKEILYGHWLMSFWSKERERENQEVTLGKQNKQTKTFVCLESAFFFLFL